MILAQTSIWVIMVLVICFLTFIVTGIVMSYYNMKLFRKIYEHYWTKGENIKLSVFSKLDKNLMPDLECNRLRTKRNKVCLIGCIIIFSVVLILFFTGLLMSKQAL